VLQIVISEEMARQEGLDLLLQEIFATPRMNHSAVPVISQGRAQELLFAQKPTLGVRLSKKILFSLEEYQKLGFIPRAQLGEVVRMMNAGSWRSGVLPYAAAQTGEGESAPAGRPYDLLAGQIPTKGGDQVVYLGAAVLGSEKLKGTLTGQEMQFLSFALDDMQEIFYECGGGYFRLTPRRGASVQAREENGQWRLRVRGGVAASPVGTASLDGAAIQEAFSQDVLNVLEKMRKWGADPAGFQGKAAKTVRTLEAWEKKDWAQQYAQAAIEVAVQVSEGEAY